MKLVFHDVTLVETSVHPSYENQFMAWTLNARISMEEHRWVVGHRLAWRAVALRLGTIAIERVPSSRPPRD